MLLADPKALTVLIGKMRYITSAIRFEWCPDLLPVQVVSNGSDFSNCRCGGGDGDPAEGIKL